MRERASIKEFLEFIWAHVGVELKVHNIMHVAPVHALMYIYDYGDQLSPDAIVYLIMEWYK